MDRSTLDSILKRLNALERDTVRIRQGDVTGGNPLTVDLGSSGVDAGAAAASHAETTARVQTLTSGKNPPLVVSTLAARVARGTDQTGILDSTETPLSFSTARYDTGEFWDAGSPTVLTIPVDGFYLLGASVTWDSNTTGIRRLAVELFTPFNLPLARTRIAASNTVEQSITTGISISMGATVRFPVYQNSTANRTISSVSLSSPEAWIALIG